jgi:hypothetical protein
MGKLNREIQALLKDIRIRSRDRKIEINKIYDEADELRDYVNGRLTFDNSEIEKRLYQLKLRSRKLLDDLRFEDRCRNILLGN